MSRTQIAAVRGRRVWDSRGRPTVEAEVTLAGGARGPGASRRPAPRPARARRSTCATAAPRSAATTSPRRWRPSTARSPRRSHGLDAADQAAVDRRLIELDGTPEQGAARRQRHDRGLDGGRPRRRGRGRPAAVAPSRRRRRDAAAAAGDPDLRRRRARRAAASTSRTSWWCARGARSFAEALDWTAEVYRAAGRAHGRGGQAQGRGRRGRLLAGLRDQRGGARDAGPRDRAGGLRARRAGRDRARRRGLRARPRRPLPARPRGARARHRRA